MTVDWVTWEKKEWEEEDIVNGKKEYTIRNWGPAKELN